MDRLTVPGIARLLGVSRPRVWQLRKRADFPKPAETEGGRDYWYESTILRWAANAGRELSRQAPVLFRPVDSDHRAAYIGGRVVGGQALFAWDTSYGRICLGYSRPSWEHQPLRKVVAAAPDADVVVTVLTPWDLHGPELRAVDRFSPERPYHPRWDDLRRHVGTPVPWWPSSLRKADEMKRWFPGAEPTLSAAIPDVDTAPLYRVADQQDPSSPVYLTLRHLAREIEASAAEYAAGDVEMFREVTNPEDVVLGAIPLPAPGTPEPDEASRRIAWRELLERVDTEAEACVDAVLSWNGGKDFPFSGIHQLEPTNWAVAEWAQRLQPAKRTAAYAVFDESQMAEKLVDPATGLPVGRDVKGRYYAAVPQQLPEGSELTQLILTDYNAWIRTADGSIYLAPECPGNGVSHGYDGSGPWALAAVVDRLLDDIHALAPSIRDGKNPPAGLLIGTTGAWKPGQVVSRQTLLQARERGRLGDARDE